MTGRWTRIAWAGCGIALVWASANINWGGEHWRTVLQADAKGYHAYLPALLLHHDPNLGFFEAIERGKYHNPDLAYDYRIAIDGRTLNRYFMGTALAQTPFFLAAHAVAHVTGHDADGFSKPYVVGVNIAAIAWVLLGLWCLARLLASFGVDDRWRAFTLAAFTFGTNLFYYTVVAPGMSHAYSFGAFAALLLLARRWEERPRAVMLPLLGAAFGLLVLIRPVNAVMLLALPIVLKDPGAALRQALQHPTAVVPAVAVAGLIPALQFAYYKAATGLWLVYSYGEEHFAWSDPHFLDLLFSYRKGLFVYTPLLLGAFAGLPFWWRTARRQVLWWAGFLAGLTWLLGSWWNWWYGGSFGSRVYVEYLPLFAVPFALAQQGLGKRSRWAFLTIAVLLVLLCQAQTYQARYYIIHWEDMDRDRYWESVRRIGDLFPGTPGP
jgi:hypothetical protein